MDPLSITAGITSITGAFSASIEAATKLWGVPDELRDLVSQLSELDTLVKRLVALTSNREFFEIDFQTLLEPYVKLKKAQDILERRLSKTNENKTSILLFSRRAWVLNRGRIKKITRDVITIRNQLCTIMLTSTLFSVTTIHEIQIKNSNSLDPLRQPIRHRSGQFDAPTSKTLTSIHPHTISGSSISIEDPAFDADTNEQQNEATDLEDFLSSASQLSEGISEALTLYTPRASLLDCPIEACTTTYPEQYIIEGSPYDRLAVYSMTELSRTVTSRIDRYFVLFAQDARHWRRVIVTATKAATSRLSDVSSAFNERTYHVLPKQVQSELERTLDRSHLYDTVTKIHIELKLSGNGGVTFDSELSRVIEDTGAATMIDTSQHFEEMKQRGIRYFRESNVTVLQYISIGAYLVQVDNQSCIERKIPFAHNVSNRTSVADFFADMKLFQLAQGCPGVARFVGVVLNDNCTQVRSYLVEYPGQGNMMNIAARARTNGVRISWNRRARWIRQIIATTASIHERGVVIGSLSLRALWVNLEDDIMLTFFKSTAGFMPNSYGLIPPELRQSTAPEAYASDQLPTFQSDIFQLGGVVWKLAEHCPGIPSPKVFSCTRTGCKTFPLQMHSRPRQPRGAPPLWRRGTRVCQQDRESLSAI